ncbi:EAL domain-containing protein [Roseivivax isoporae]|uniref:Diguanylate phosphodiesterase n=1 Tax=Roseivivax isoporae LMG 25204 TaxID=1449351 RepID=X7FES0_9RHOB|nr:EAL domain-containing protein [Roseivivax isoporae]ETX30536.1 diguanylate phosphodiesterase [Roseivivax isoporae LMG 25204]
MPPPQDPDDPRNALDAALSVRDRDVVATVTEAVRHGQVRLAFQPVVAAQAQGRVAFYESFVRVLDPTGRIIPAAEFMREVDETEAGRLLDCAALDRGLCHLRETPDLRLAVNMSARSIGFPRWRQLLERGLRDDPTLGERLILEIAEPSAMLLPDLTLDFMRACQPLGIAFALDDFGSDVTRFRWFRELPFDILKFDGQFVRGVAGDPDNQVLLRAFQALATEFDLLTVAESVENAADAAFLAGIGVTCLQGYYFAAPTLQPPWRDTAGRASA